MRSPDLARLLDDSYLQPYADRLIERAKRIGETEQLLTGGKDTLEDFASGHEYYGLHFSGGEWAFREWAPNATAIYLVGDFSDWNQSLEFALTRISENGTWEIKLPADQLKHGDLYRLNMHWPNGQGERIPTYTRRAVQDASTHIFTAQVWHPETSYQWKHPRPVGKPKAPLIYESHVGMAQEDARVGTYLEFKGKILPRVIKAGYNTIQLMGIMEHPYYGSFGYHVSNFFAASSRCGTPEELKELIDDAHEAGIAVIMDLVHSHAVKNENEGLARFDGTDYQFFHAGARGDHVAWDSRCFDYSKPEVLHFLLSNCRFWIDEYNFDGFRFDGITSMLYTHHGLGTGFGSYENYFDGSVDNDAIAYLALANKIIHTVRPAAITIAEDVSGMPGLGAPQADGGCGFDYRLAMGMPDCWFKLVNDTRDEDWNLNWLYHELTSRRQDEQVISYVESHDQALVGGKSMIFELIDAHMYDAMHKQAENMVVDRGMALHKMARLATLASAAHGYLNFMGNEFGHPEWIDFPREGNGWSYHYARRQWSLRDNPDLKFHFLADFDEAMLEMANHYGTVGGHQPHHLKTCDNDKVMAFEHNGLFFFFNFHPSNSYTDYGIEIPPGEYQLVLNTDEPRFGGYNRLEDDQRYATRKYRVGDLMHHQILLYLPSRCALVLAKA
ncbi:MAG: alpha amylase C-terminal domain-containing protein [Kiritimatiellales bacterium]|nr:alpha amylase C-terminal domain-containing protein [Kiritimatiellales bacterium]